MSDAFPSGKAFLLALVRERPGIHIRDAAAELGRKVSTISCLASHLRTEGLLARSGRGRHGGFLYLPPEVPHADTEPTPAASRPYPITPEAIGQAFYEALGGGQSCQAWAELPPVVQARFEAGGRKVLDLVAAQGGV